MADQAVGASALVGQSLGHYRIVEKIGAGGMGEVYRAHDEHLDREIAIKILPPGTLADEHARHRFRKEALALSKLNHPNIATIHDFDTQDGVDFLVMEYIAGVTLSNKLAAGPMPEKEVVVLGTQLAEGLSAAHEHGIIHRDVKPGNLRLTSDGWLKILDFGLARLRATEAADSTVESFSRTEAIAGTLPYMAPEQLLGEQVDARTDIHAAGAVLYEMATGHRPFAEVEPSQLIVAILRRPAATPTTVNPRVGAELDRIITKCLEKDRDHRYQTARELAADLRGLAVRPLAASARAVPIGPLSRHRRVRIPAAIAALLLLGTGALVWKSGGLPGLLSARSSAANIRSLAVLPLANLSGDSSQDYFADGMTEALIGDLSKIHALKVISRTSIMQYKATVKPLPQIARELGVEGILEGSVQRAGGRVRVTTQLINAATDTHLWAATYERQMEDVLALQSEVASSVAREIQVALTPDETRRLTRAHPVNPEAYEAYLRGRFHWYRLSKLDLDYAERYFQAALEKDPNYALAYVGLADVWMSRTDIGVLSPQETMDKSRAAALHALELDDTLADAHVTLANLQMFERDYPAAEREFNRAIQLNPSHANAHFMYADALISQLRKDEWAAEIRRALDLDPMSYFFQCFYGWHLTYLGRYDEAIAETRKALSSEPNFSSAHMGLWAAYHKKGMDHEAVKEAERFFEVLGDEEVVHSLQTGYAEAGYRRAMKRAGDTLAARSRHSHVPAVRVARLYAHAGENDRAMTWLEKADAAREGPLVHLAVARDWDGLRSDPRFQELMRRMRLPQQP